MHSLYTYILLCRHFGIQPKKAWTVRCLAAVTNGMVWACSWTPLIMMDRWVKGHVRVIDEYIKLVG